ncbi:MAG: hypothetical protein AAF639_41820 [Chloroflexota bacterium]
MNHATFSIINAKQITKPSDEARKRKGILMLQRSNAPPLQRSNA